MTKTLRARLMAMLMTMLMISILCIPAAAVGGTVQDDPAAIMLNEESTTVDSSEEESSGETADSETSGETEEKDSSDSGTSADEPGGEVNSGEEGGSEATPEADKFPFTVYLKDAEGNDLEGEYQYTGTLAGSLHSGSIVYLSDQDYIDIQNLPEGTQYEVIEGETEGYSLQSSENTKGTIVMDELSHAKFVNEKIFLGPRLPESGGEGVMGIMVLGASCLVFGGLLVSKRKYFQ